jgi:hypothetical protein
MGLGRGVFGQGPVKVALTLPMATAAAITALLEGRPQGIDPAELPRLRALLEQIQPAAAARRLAVEEPEGSGPASGQR